MKLKSLFLLSLTAMLPAMGMWNNDYDYCHSNAAKKTIIEQCFKECIRQNNIEKIKQYLEYDTRWANCFFERNMTALMFTTMYDRNGCIVKLLMHSGANIFAQDNDGETAYDYATQFGLPRIALYLLNVSRNSSLN